MCMAYYGCLVFCPVHCKPVHCAVPENIHTHPKRVTGKLRGRGVSKAKIFKRKYKTKLEFQEGWGGGGLKPKEPYVGVVWILSGTTHVNMLNKTKSQ